MDSSNISNSPYYDDFDPSKNFTQILAVPGRAEQAREFTQAQSIMLNIIKQLSSAVLKEGSIVEGFDFQFTGSDSKTLSVDKGKIYLDGIVHNFQGATLTLSKKGREDIGAKLVKTIVTEAEDTSLRDPAQGFVNYGRPGAHRIRSEVQLVVNDETAPTILKFYDGELQVVEERPQLEIINTLLARRTFDESGNFKVNGFDMIIGNYDDDNVLLTVEAGKAYVQGFEVNRPSPARVIIPKAKETRDVLDEPKQFHAAQLTYMLNNYPVKEIKRVTATVETTTSITRGSTPNGSDFLPFSPVVSIVSIVGYTQGTDYQLSADRVDWSLPGNEPPSGSSYTVTYRYNKQLSTSDYKLTEVSDKHYIEFTSGGAKPVAETTFTLDYSYYLARADRVYLDSNGDVNIVPGQSDRYQFVNAPADADAFRLSLGTYKLSPNSSKAEVENRVIKRVSMSDMYNILQRLDNLEYNQAFSALDKEAMEGEQASNLKGILSDGFIGFSKSDLGHKDYTAATDVLNYELVLPATQKVYKPVVNGSATTAKRFPNDGVFTLSYNEQAVLSQLVATSKMNVNPYLSFKPTPILKPTPTSDNWVDTETINIQDITKSTQQVWGFWGTQTNLINMGTTSYVTQTILPYARQIEITLSANDFPSYTDNLACYFDGVLVNLTPLDSTTAGTTSGTVKADISGKVSCKFKIPPNIRTGAREIVLKNADYEARSVFTSSSVRLTTTNVTKLNELTTIGLGQQPTTPVDPLAQSFQLSENRFLTSVDLYFASKDSVRPATVQIREMQNGFPSTVILAEKVLQPSEIQVSANGTAATRVSFSNPVYCEKGVQYCITVLTTSDKYELYVAKLAEKNIVTGAIMTAQPYADGVLFSSSNSLTWSVHQDADLKFGINCATFASSGVVEFDYIPSVDVDALVLAVEAATVQDTIAVWEYRDAVGGAWYPITPYEAKNLNKIATTVSLRLKLSTNNVYNTPVISGETLMLIGLKTQTSGTYVSRLVETSQNFTTIRQVVEAVVPSGVTVNVKLSIDDKTWVGGTLTSTEPIDTEFSRYTYEYTIPSSGTSKKFRSRIEMSTGNRTVKPRVRKLINIMK